MSAWLATQGASLLSALINFGIFIGSIAIAIKLHELLPIPGRGRWPSKLIGVAIWISAITLLFLLFGPAAHMLRSYSCRDADDYEFCMEPPDTY